MPQYPFHQHAGVAKCHAAGLPCGSRRASAHHYIAKPQYTGTQTDRETHTQTHTLRDTHTHRQTHTHTNTHTQTHTHTQALTRSA